MEDLYKTAINTIVREKLFLRTDLTLEELAEMLGCDSADIKKAFEESVSIDFDSVVNFLRVEEAKRVMHCIKPNWCLHTVAKTSGFNSLTSFFRSFKDVTGQTPFKYFIKNHCKEANPDEKIINSNVCFAQPGLPQK